MARVKPDFDKRTVRIIGLSVDAVGDHRRWVNDIKETQGYAPNYPLIGDSDFNVSKLYDMMPASAAGDPATRTPADNQTVRNVFVVGPDKNWQQGEDVIIAGSVSDAEARGQYPQGWTAPRPYLRIVPQPN